MNGFLRGLLQVYSNSDNDPKNRFDDVPAYALFNLYAGVRAEDGSWEVSAYGKNLFNTLRVTDRGSVPTGVATNLGTQLSSDRVISTTEPREFGLTARWRSGRGKPPRSLARPIHNALVQRRPYPRQRSARTGLGELQLFERAKCSQSYLMERGGLLGPVDFTEKVQRYQQWGVKNLIFVVMGADRMANARRLAEKVISRRTGGL